MSNPYDPCKRKKLVRQMKSGSNVRKPSTSYVDSSSSSGAYPTESLESEGSDECRRNLSSRHGKQVIKTTPSDELKEYNSSEDDSTEPGCVQMPSKDYCKENGYVLQGKFDLTEGQREKLDALVRKVQPEIPVLVVMMKKTNVKLDALEILKDYAIKHFPQKNQTIRLMLPGKSKDWSCDFHIRSDGSGQNLYLGNFICDNRVCAGDLCIFQPVTKADQRRFMVTVHLLREASIGRYPLGRNDIGRNHGIIQKKLADSVDTPKGYEDDDTKQPSGRKRYASGQTGHNSPFEYDSFESGDNRTPRGPNYGLSLGSYLSGAQYEKVTAHVERIQPETSVFIAVMSQRDVELPSPLLNISEEHAIAHFPPESVTVTLQRPGKCNKWHPRFYMAKDRRQYVLTGHWLDFICDNSVQEGDICIFVPEKGGGRSKFTVHLLRREKTHLRGGTGGGKGAGSHQGKTNKNIASPAHIMEESTEGEKDSSESNMHSVSDERLETENCDGPPEPPYILPGKSALSPSQEKIVKAKVQAIQSEVPIYVSIMKKSNVGAIRNHTLELGSRYVTAFLPRRTQMMVLQCHGKVWETKMVHRNGKRWFLSGGWSKFARDNRLRIGDICLFELRTNKKTLTMRVHIVLSK
uniref:Uncharacterized protein n=1 Tax=Avena sativa TaxID=4498 RepID=A0ACD5W9Q6_AVESA